MRALLLSDSHGDESNLRWLIQQCWRKYPHFDAYFHCGDGAREFSRLQAWLRANDPRAVIRQVCGNCDFGFDAPDHAIIPFGGAFVYLTHGQYLRVKQGLALLDEEAAAGGCTVAVYGHTHIQATDIRRTLMINPGAACDGQAAVLEMENGRPRVLMERFA